MPDIFDTLAPEQQQSGDIFDQIANEPKGDIFDQVSEQSQPSATPETDKALNQSREAMRPNVSESAQQGVMDVVKGIPSMVKQLPGLAYQGAKFAIGGTKEKTDVAIEMLKQAIPQGQQLSKDLQSPVGSREWTRGMIQAGLMAAPALDLVKPLFKLEPEIPIEKPPVQPESPPIQPGTTASDVTKAVGRMLWPEEVETQKPSVTGDITRDILDKRNALVNEAQQLAKQAKIFPNNPVIQNRLSEIREELNKPQWGETDASRITSTTSVPELEIRPQVGEETPLRQQGETAGAQEQPVSSGEPLAPATSEEPNAPRSLEADLSKPSGISTERLQELYGKDSVIINKGKGAKAWQAAGEADKRDPYALLTQARRRGIAPPEDVAKLRNEHQKLLSAARQSYGTPAYPQLAQYAADFANAMKSVAHGPASDVMRALQEADVPKYDSPADFDSIIRERMQRESTPKEQETFGKISDELKNGDTEVKKTALDAQNRLKKYLPKEEVSFDQAVDHVRKQIEELTKPCQL